MTEFSFLANCSFNFFPLSLAPVNTRFKIFIAKTAKLISTRVGMLQAQVLHSNYGPVIEVSLSNKIQQVTQRVAVTTLNSSRGCKHTHTHCFLSFCWLRAKPCQNESGCHPDRQLWGIIHLISPTEKTHVKQHTVQLVCLGEESVPRYTYCTQRSKIVCRRSVYVR